jgi:hypothetical protein
VIEFRGLWRAVLLAVLLTGGSAMGQAAGSPVAPAFIQRAETVHVPVFAVQKPATPLTSLRAEGLTVDVNGKPMDFQLTQPVASAGESAGANPQARVNVLIILPFGAPVDRKGVLARAVTALNAEPDEGWNISILDDSGAQTPYAKGLKPAIASLTALETTDVPDVDIDEWRDTATEAITSMRDLAGRRVVLTLGDIYHEVIYDEGELAYDNYQVDDVSNAARLAGAVIYSAESIEELNQLRGLYPYFTIDGDGPYLMLDQQQHIAGWITGNIADTWNKIRQDGRAWYTVDLHLTPAQMNGQLHAFSATPHATDVILDAPPFYVAPSLQQLRNLEKVPPAVREALKHPPAENASPLALATQLAYFPHPDGKNGTQIATTGFFWTQNVPRPSKLDVALQLEQTTSGFLLTTTVGTLRWTTRRPVWNTSFEVVPGAYMLRIAAADDSGKAKAAVDTPFTVQGAQGESVLISSLVIGKSCQFAPPAPSQPNQPPHIDYLRAGNCDIDPDPGHYYSPQDVIWALVRMTPTGKMTRKKPTAWKPTFEIVDAKGSKRFSQQVAWLPAADGSLVANAAIPLDNPKLHLENGQYSVVFRLKGPDIESDYGQQAPFLIYGAEPPTGQKQ